MDLKNTIRYVVSRNAFLKKHVTMRKIAKKRKYMFSDEQVMASEKDDQTRQKLLDEFRKKNPVYVAKFEAEAMEILRKSQGEVNATCYDMLWCYLAYGFQQDEYIMFGFKDKDSVYRRSFISDVERYDIYYRNNNLYDRMVLINKYDTYKKFGKFYGREIIKVESERDFYAFQNFIAYHKKIVVKNPILSRGDSVHAIDCSDLSQDETKKLFKDIIRGESAIVEEMIVQGKELSIFHPDSVNTLRCTTIVRDGDVIVFYPFIKMGQFGMFVDNGGKGGILAGVDAETGRVCSDGLDESGVEYVTHPNTGILISGYQLPMWNKCLELVKECARSIPSVRVVGWDVAWSDKGWVIVEGNAQGQFVGQQSTIKKGLKKELGEALGRY